jgi:3-phenylpropionate/trans-cinnamate dioxygenase ferredoxin reductase subunit
MDAGSLVIVGAGLAGAKAAATLREEGHTGPILLVGDEPHPPYERPPLSKGHLRGESPLRDAYVFDEGWYAEHHVELMLGVRATALDPAARTVTLSDAGTVRYDRLLLATGASPRTLPVPGGDLPGVHVLRDAGHAAALSAALKDASRAVVAGAGWIGCEVAASARMMGVDVTLVEPQPVPLRHVMGDRIGGFFTELHTAHGVDVRTGEGVRAIEGGGRAERVVLTSGETVDCDLVVAGVGVTPNDGLAARAGLEVDDGVIVDSRLRASAPDVFAAGDVARIPHPLFGSLRVEHWANALHQGPAAARSMLGRGEPYERIPYFFSDQYDTGLEYTGQAGPDDELVVHGDMSSGAFVALWIDPGARLRAALTVNVWDVIGRLQGIIAEGRPVERSVLLATIEG